MTSGCLEAIKQLHSDVRSCRRKRDVCIYPSQMPFLPLTPSPLLPTVPGCPCLSRSSLFLERLTVTSTLPLKKRVVGVLVSWGCCKLGGLNDRNFQLLTVWRPENQGIGRTASLGASEGESVP